jgi:DNA polymerase III alpha subunit (gram-positive type)
MRKVIFDNPEKIISGIEDIIIKCPPVNYSMTESSKNEEKELIEAYTQKANEIFGDKWPDFVSERIKREWDIIKGRYVFIY